MNIPMDNQAPATKADIQNMEQTLLQAMQKMHKDLNKADDEILTVLTNVDKRLTTKVEDHEGRITQLESIVA
jgi:hypothetical protein